jgi:hypothetical protein
MRPIVMLGVGQRTQEGPDMFKRIRGTCHEGNVCPTVMLDTETNEVLVQGPLLDPFKETALRLPGGEGVVRVPVDLLCGLTPEDFQRHDEDVSDAEH